ncbi:MAG TPA: hypothetical protein VFE52_04170 [Devosia sp.]|jgi:hypothetical protein|nr:hypothetical protein [Devosia sp.]
MTPARAIAMLDRQIGRHGQTVTLTRHVSNGSPVTLTCRAFVRGYKPDELANGVIQGDSLVVISPTALEGTPFGTTLPAPVNKLTTAGRQRNIAMVDPVYINDVLVRLSLQVRG